MIPLKTNKFKSMKKIQLFLSIVLFLSFTNLSKAQQPLLYNQGSIYILAGENVYVHGGFLNSGNGQVTNGGILHVAGDWTNNASNQVFPTANGTIRLFGADQLIGGSNATGFGDLTLAGTGIKTLNINTTIAGVLSLNDRELSTQNYILTILSSDANAITRTSGFVSTAVNGSLLRNTNGTGTWLFPMGGSNPALGYRPVDVEPFGGGVGAFEVTLGNSNPTLAGYNINQYQSPVCLVNHKYFHKVKRVLGSGNVNLKYYYDNSADGAFTIPVTWSGTNWNIIGNSTHTSNSSPNLSSFNLSNFTLQNPSIIAFADSAPANGTPIIYELNNVLYAGQGNTFQWYLNGNIINGATQNSYTPTTQGVYSVFVSTSGSCSFMSGDYNFYFVDIKEQENNPGISVYPNPFTTYITLDINEYVDGDIEYMIYNNIGKLITQGLISDIKTSRKHTVDVYNLSPGIYFLKIINKNLHFTEKLIMFGK